jgi:cytochrome c oxidase subunit 4
MNSLQSKFRAIVENPDNPDPSVTSPHATDHVSHAAGFHVHVTTPWLLLGVFGALLVLTIMTVAAVTVDVDAALGIKGFNIAVALGIAVVKAALVLLYFMHLRWDNLFNGMIVIFALLFIAIFLFFAIVDTTQYASYYNPPPAVGPGK